MRESISIIVCTDKIIVTAAWSVCGYITVNAAIESFSLVLAVSFRSEFFDPSPGRVRSCTTAELSSVLKVSSVQPVGLGMPALA